MRALVARLLAPRLQLQMRGTVSKEDGTPMLYLEGKWNEYLDACER